MLSWIQKPASGFLCADSRAHTHTCWLWCYGKEGKLSFARYCEIFCFGQDIFYVIPPYIHTFNINLCLCALFVVFFSWSSMWCEISFCLWVIRLAEEWLFCKNGQRRVLVQNWCTSVSNKTWQQAVQLDQWLSNNHFCFHFLLHLLFSLLYSLVWILCIFFVVQERVCGEVIFAMVVFCYSFLMFIIASGRRKKEMRIYVTTICFVSERALPILYSRPFIF